MGFVFIFVYSFCVTYMYACVVLVVSRPSDQMIASHSTRAAVRAFVDAKRKAIYGNLYR